MKKHGYQRPLAGFQPIHMPANTGAGIVIAGLSTVFGFAMIWHMWPLAAASFAATVLASIIHTFNYQRDYHIPAAEVAATEAARTQQMAAAHV
jgi:cytochrome o ubiquinol oxidase subunit 1